MELETLSVRAQPEKLAQGSATLPHVNSGRASRLSAARITREREDSTANPFRDRNTQQRIPLGSNILFIDPRRRERAGHCRLSHARGPRRDIGSGSGFKYTRGDTPHFGGGIAAAVTHDLSRFRITLAKFNIAGCGLCPTTKGAGLRR